MCESTATTPFRRTFTPNEISPIKRCRFFSTRDSARCLRGTSDFRPFRDDKTEQRTASCRLDERFALNLPNWLKYWGIGPVQWSCPVSNIAIEEAAFLSAALQKASDPAAISEILLIIQRRFYRERSNGRSGRRQFTSLTRLERSLLITVLVVLLPLQNDYLQAAKSDLFIWWPRWCVWSSSMSESARRSRGECWREWDEEETCRRSEFLQLL